MTQVTEFFFNSFRPRPPAAFDMLQHVLKQRPFNIDVLDDQRKGGERQYRCECDGIQTHLLFTVQCRKQLMPRMAVYTAGGLLLLELDIKGYCVTTKVSREIDRNSLTHAMAVSISRKLLDLCLLYAEQNGS